MYNPLPLRKDGAKIYAVDLPDGDGQLILTPYPTENVLARVYLKLEEQGLLDIVFHEGRPVLSWFIERFSKEPTLTCWHKRPSIEGYPEVCLLGGMTWFNARTKIGGTEHIKAETGLFFFRKLQVHGWPSIWAHMSTEWAFEHLGIDTIFGVTPATNRAAVRFIRRLGWNLYGPVPGFTSYDEKPCEAWFSCMTKLRWTEMRDSIFVSAASVSATTDGDLVTTHENRV